MAWVRKSRLIVGLGTHVQVNAKPTKTLNAPNWGCAVVNSLALKSGGCCYARQLVEPDDAERTTTAGIGSSSCPWRIGVFILDVDCFVVWNGFTKRYSAVNIIWSNNNIRRAQTYSKDNTSDMEEWDDTRGLEYCPIQLYRSTSRLSVHRTSPTLAFAPRIGNVVWWD